MAHSLSAKKRIRQNAKHRAINRARKKQIRLSVRDLEEAIQSGDKAQSTTALKAAIKKLDQVAAKGAIHKNTASRKKSRLTKQLNAALRGCVTSCGWFMMEMPCTTALPLGGLLAIR